MITKDQNGRTVSRNIKQTTDGSWGANVWFGHDHATNLRRYYYQTKEQARKADISDEPGKRGCVRFGEYAA